MELLVFFGNFYHTLSLEKCQSVLDGFIAIENGKVSYNITNILLISDNNLV